MNKFIKNVFSAIAIACGSAVLVGGNYCAYASQREEHDSVQYDEAFLAAVTQVFVIDKDGRPKKGRLDGTLAGIGAGNMLWFVDRQLNKVIVLYSKEQNQNAEELACSIRKVTGKDVSVFSLENAMRLVPGFETARLYFLFKEAGGTLFGRGSDLFDSWKYTLFNKGNYIAWLKETDINDDALASALQGNLQHSQDYSQDGEWSIFINYLSHTEPIFVLLVATGIFKPDLNIGVYSILNPCNSCKWLFDTTTQLNCKNCFLEEGSDRIFFHYLAIDGQHRKKESKNWDVRWHIWRPTTYNRVYNYGDNDIVDKQE